MSLLSKHQHVLGKGCPDPSQALRQVPETESLGTGQARSMSLCAVLGPQVRATYFSGPVLSTLANPLNPHKGPDMTIILILQLKKRRPRAEPWPQLPYLVWGHWCWEPT